MGAAGRTLGDPESDLCDLGAILGPHFDLVGYRGRKSVFFVELIFRILFIPILKSAFGRLGFYNEVFVRQVLQKTTFHRNSVRKCSISFVAIFLELRGPFSKLSPISFSFFACLNFEVVFWSQM